MKPQNPFSQNPAPECSPPTTTINPVLEKSAGLGGEFPAPCRSQSGKRGCGQDGGGAKAAYLTVLSRRPHS